ncbi:transmembrane protein 243-like [Physella acuta]|uniref:transmembrane protein 243-like n=1 Tax=Physella acuta TaxID=109671 RepID=UPI0027DAE9C5|nr:transmembrane protein 243-like [Physella acuta]XP_059179442.1 transmembrane protein 243-like [Physella acuta]XP_059179443.1 transmembrane protein 243-like [Physella acuta]XP_059179444.1 transmembrane protein 243-like [Physella acuta]XP_059179445.1 transmembrane protein 243-like [Physella acuta]
MERYRETDPLDRPLFGAPSSVDRVVNLVIGTVTGIIVLVTLISAFVFPQWPPDGVNVFFALVIVLICASHLVLVYWYRLGDLEPKFRTMIFYNAFTIVLLCVVGNLYIHGVAKRSQKG